MAGTVQADPINIKELYKDVDIDVENLDLSFCGCGFLGIYHLGVAAAFQHYLPGVKFNHLSGASAGAIAATGLAAGVPISEMAVTLMDAAEDAREYWGGPFSPLYQVSVVLRKALEQMLPDDITDRLDGKLSISMTKVDTGNSYVISTFASKQELIKIIVSSSFIPLFSGLVPAKVRGKRVIDGGFSINMLKQTPQTITVSPLAGDADICPLDDTFTRKHDISRINLAAQGHDLTVKNLNRLKKVLFPPGTMGLGDILEQGFHDAHRYLRKKGVAPCQQCMTIRSTVKQREPISRGVFGNEPCMDKLECHEVAKKTYSVPFGLGKLSDLMHQLTHGPEVEVTDHNDELTSEEVSRIGSSIAWKVMRNSIWYFPPFWFLRKSCDVIDWMGHAFMDLLLPILDMIPFERILAKEALVRAFEEAVSKTLHQVTEYFQMQHMLERIEAQSKQDSSSGGEVINCEVSIRQHGQPSSSSPLDDLESTSEMLDLMLSDEELERRRERLQQRASRIQDEPGGQQTDDEQSVLELEVNAISEHRRNSKPRNMAEARLLQNENLLLASSQSRAVSRVTSRVSSRVASRAASRVASRVASRRGSRQSSRTSSRRNSLSSPAAGSSTTASETLDNIRRVTEVTESCLAYYYKNEAGDLVLVNLYDITDTDPADLLGADVLDDVVLDEAALEQQEAEDDPAWALHARQRQRHAPAAQHQRLDAIDPSVVEHRLRKVTPRHRWQSGDDGSK